MQKKTQTVQRYNIVCLCKVVATVTNCMGNKLQREVEQAKHDKQRKLSSEQEPRILQQKQEEGGTEQ